MGEQRFVGVGLAQHRGPGESVADLGGLGAGGDDERDAASAEDPGELARLLTEIGEAGVNMEDLRLEHSPGAQVGLAEISVVPEVERQLVAELEKRGWRIAEAWQ